MCVSNLKKTIAFGDVNKKTLEKRNRKEKEKSEKTLTVFLFHFEFERRFSFAFSLFFFVHVFCVVTDCFFQICKKAAMTTYQSLALGFFIAIGLVVSVCGERFEVTSAQQLIELLDLSKANNFDAKITLLDDLDFSFSPLTLPFGVSSDGSCVSYTGVFEGNGHTIKGLVMNNKDNKEYYNAGLFCGLENATFENLVIDSSCSFTGYSYVGALSVSLTGSLTATNVTNKAAVSGEVIIAGFVGVIEGLNQGVDVTFKHCANDGIITGPTAVGGFVGQIQSNSGMNVTFSDSINNGKVNGINTEVGGFIGFMSDNTNIKMTISNCINNGNVTGSDDTGGFLGYSQGNWGISMIISNCTNNGTVTGDIFVGGFVGDLFGNDNMAMTISNCANAGLITGYMKIGGFTGDFYSNTESKVIISNCANSGSITGNNYVGGFTGIIESQTNMVMTLSNCTNTGEVSGTNFVGGLVGSIENTDNWNFISFIIINSVNKGNVSAKNEIACGMFCVDQGSNQSMNITVLNSINKGSVNATASVYGITNSITKARNVVSMGKVNASSDSFTFWQSSTDANLFFGMDGKCVNCTDGMTLFVHNTNTGFYEVESGEHVNDLLNAEVEKQNYGMFWTEELEFVEAPDYPSPSPSQLPSSPSSQSGGLSGGNKHGVSLFLTGVVVALAVHVAMAQ